MKPLFQWVSTTQAARAMAAKPADPSNPIANRIEQAFDSASTSTGTSFDYLVKTAQRESAMNPSAKARTSSAAGLFQFIESTWLETLKNSGPELGLGDIADKIEVRPGGKYRVADPADREAILALRFDPEVASMMAGALTRKNAAYLTDKIGREPNAGELYIAHFLGAKGASDLITLANANPDATAADYFPRQAGANKPIFYENGRARSVSEVYAELVRTHGGDVPAMEPAVMTAYAPVGNPVATEAFAAQDPRDRVAAGWRAAAPADAFSALFRTDQASVQPTAAAAFWRGYTMAPALFDVAVAEDARALAVERREAEERARANSASLAAQLMGEEPDGPLDLSRFLKPDDV
jgi:hypothetical protein